MTTCCTWRYSTTRCESLRLLLPHARDIAATTALSAAVSTGNTTAARLLLDAGADPSQLLDAGLLGESHEQEPPVPPLFAAVALAAGPELTGLLLEHGADPDGPGPGGRTPYQLAVRTGQDEVAELLAQHGAGTTLSPADALLAACRHADRAGATALLAADPDLIRQLTAGDYQALAGAADHGATEAVRLMLDLGFPPGARSYSGRRRYRAAPGGRRRQHRYHPAAAGTRRGHRGPRHHLGQYPAGMGHRRQRPAAWSHTGP